MSMAYASLEISMIHSMPGRRVKIASGLANQSEAGGFMVCVYTREAMQKQIAGAALLWLLKPESAVILSTR